MPRDIDELPLEEIMRRWPATLEVFMAWKLRCIGCPIADFHQLSDAAAEHGYALGDLRFAVLLATGDSSISVAPAEPRRRSAPADVDCESPASGVRYPRSPPLAKP